MTFSSDYQPNKLERQLNYIRAAIFELQQNFTSLQLAILGQDAKMKTLMAHLSINEQQLVDLHKSMKAEDEKQDEQNRPSEETIKTIDELKVK